MKTKQQAIVECAERHKRGSDIVPIFLAGVNFAEELIPLKDEKPEYGIPILLYGGELKSDLSSYNDKPVVNDVCLAYRGQEDDGRDYWGLCHSCYYSMWIENPTHWRPLNCK